MGDVPSRALARAGEAFLASDAVSALEDVGLFAVRFADGALGYCEAEWDMDGQPGLTLYMDGNGLASYSRMELALRGDSAVRLYQAQRRLECLECACEVDEEGGVSLFYGIRRPFYDIMPIMDAGDDACLRAALEAAVCLAGMIGRGDFEPEEGVIPLLTESALSTDGFIRSGIALAEDVMVSSTSITLNDAQTVAALRAKRRGKRSRLLCELVSWPYPVVQDGAERYPVGLLLFEQSTPWLACPVVYCFEEERDYLLDELIGTLLTRGVPRTVVMRDDMTIMTLWALFEQLGATVVIDDEVPALDEAIGMLYEREGRWQDEGEAGET